MWALPAGAAAFRWGAYSNYRAGGRYNYPYMMGGRTVYVQIDVDSSGNPLPPPPPSEIDIDD
jgi:hypothetical protein